MIAAPQVEARLRHRPTDDRQLAQAARELSRLGLTSLDVAQSLRIHPAQAARFIAGSE